MKGNHIMSWAERTYSKNQINKAGKKIVSDTIPEEEKKQAIKIIGNYRSSHAYPLYVISKKLRNMLSSKYASKRMFVVHRLKRLDSIVSKLKRMPGMGLFGMQDIGGCRVVVNTIKQVYDVANQYENSRIRHTLYKENDYIASPKPSGYRSLHRVYKYVSDKKECYNNMCIEIQFRTYLQHIWATAVETMGLYTKTNLKASDGDEHYLYFFKLVSSLFAIKEGCPVVPNTPNNIEELKSKILALNNEYRILDKLESIRKAVKVVEKRTNKAQGNYFLLSLDLLNKLLTIEEYGRNELNEANDRYNSIEEELNPDIDIVLVSAKSFDELTKAYPNYFGDVGKFISLIKSEIG